MADRTCSVDGCGKPHHSHGFCSSHGSRWKAHGDPLAGKRFAAPGATCSVEGCDVAVHAYGLCNSHAHKMRAHGDPLLGREQKARDSLTSRFWTKVAITPSCWLWLAATNQNGYGTFSHESRPCKAHRFAYELLVGPIPEGLVLDHLCRVRNCVNPSHLEPVTQVENLRRARV